MTAKLVKRLSWQIPQDRPQINIKTNAFTGVKAIRGIRHKA
jgi:hypothetical protein